MKQRGLGDSLHAISKAIGIEALVKQISPNCNCAKRREWLNEKVNYNKWPFNK